MSWYSKIYIYVREFRARNPKRGFILHLCLYTMLIIQICGIGYAYSTYTFLTCGFWLTSVVQKTIYLIIYNSLLILMLWSLIMTICTPVSRISKEYYVGAEIDQQLKEITPKLGDRYHPDTSNPEQVQQQNKILDDFACSNNLTFVEMDVHGKLRYCYLCACIKPDRSHHCSSCGFCVVKFDHHCPWINKCVSHRNYKYFLLYLFYGTAFLVFELITSLEVIVRFGVSDNISDKWEEFVPVAVSILIHIGFSYYPLGELLIYHARLVWDNETTCEQAKTPLIRGDPHASYNITPYLNYRSVFGWGLWAFPVPTFVSDGCHFNIRYSDNYNGERYDVVPLSTQKQQQTATSSRRSPMQLVDNNNNNNNKSTKSILPTTTTNSAATTGASITGAPTAGAGDAASPISPGVGSEQQQLQRNSKSK